MQQFFTEKIIEKETEIIKWMLIKNHTLEFTEKCWISVELCN